MKAGVWILVGVASIGVFLYAHELYRQRMEREEALSAYLDSMKTAADEAVKADELRKAREETESSIKEAAREIDLACYGKIAEGLYKKSYINEGSCKFARAMSVECVQVLNEQINKGSVPKESCLSSMSEPGHAMSMDIH